MSSHAWLGLDIGGTRLKGGILDARGSILATEVEQTRSDQTLPEFEAQLDALITRLTTSVRRHKLSGIGAAITGPVDPERGCLYLPGKISGLDRHKTVPYLRRRWRVPVTADNDGRLACYAEWRAGAGRRVQNLVVFTLGTGIGSGVVMDGRLLTDRHFQRGTQCGHAVIDLHGPRCLTGVNGTGESVASITAFVHEVANAIARGLPADLPRTGSGSKITFPDIVAALRRGDEIVTKLFGGWLDRFAVVLLNSYYAYTPDLILLAGGPVRSAALWRKPLEDRLNASAFRVPTGFRIPVRIARFKENAGWMGAALRIQEMAT